MPSSLNVEPIRAAAPRTGQAANKFAKGDQVLLHVRHLHGYHATVTVALGNDEYIVRINEENHAGLLAQYSGADLEPAKPSDLGKHQNQRLSWDYPAE